MNPVWDMSWRIKNQDEDKLQTWNFCPMDPIFYKFFHAMKDTLLVNNYNCATCGQGTKIYHKRNDLNNHFKNQQDFVTPCVLR